MLLTAASILYYNIAIKNNRSVEEYTASINALIFAKDYSGAVAECSDGIRRYPESVDLYILKAHVHMLSGDTAKAIGTLDYGYKQTQSGLILEQREQLAEEFGDDVEYLPLTETGDFSEKPDGSSAAVGAPGDSETAKEPYRPDSSIKVTIPNVSPPPPPKENTEVSSPETSTGLGENKTESE